LIIDEEDYLPIVVLTADATLESRRAALQGGATDFITKPFDHVEALARVRNLLDARHLHVQLQRHNERLEDAVRERTADLRRAIDRLQLADHDLRLAQEETIHRLSLATDFRDDETSRHIERMSRYCAILAARAGKDARDCELLRLASKLHDIGKLGIPDAILRKPGRLTPEEFEIIKEHPKIGHQILHGSNSELARVGAMLAWTHMRRSTAPATPAACAARRYRSRVASPRSPTSSTPSPPTASTAVRSPLTKRSASCATAAAPTSKQTSST